MIIVMIIGMVIGMPTMIIRYIHDNSPIFMIIGDIMIIVYNRVLSNLLSCKSL